MYKYIRFLDIFVQATETTAIKLKMEVSEKLSGSS